MWWESTKHTNLILVCLFLCVLAGKPCLSIGGDTLSRGQSLSGTQTLISEDGIFELGFFTPSSNSSQNTYLGIWYKDFPERTTVWVANRETPLRQGSIFKIAQNGNLVLMFHDSDALWSTNLMSTLPDTVEAVLLDSGNLILRDGSAPSTVFWQSFDHPTDTWLPGAALGLNKINGRAQRLVSWKNADDPSPGMFSVEISQDQEFEFFLRWNMYTTYWRSGAWTGAVFGSVPEISYLTSFTFVSNENSTYYTYAVLNRAVLSRFVINAVGNFEQLTSLRIHHSWNPTFILPKSQSDVFAYCGAFGVFVGSPSNPSNPCACLRGFAQTRPNDSFGGCYRKTPLQCGSSNTIEGVKYGFLEVLDTTSPADPTSRPSRNSRGCESACRQSCSCTAYAFNGSGCFVWEGDLFDLRRTSNNQDSKRRLYVKLASSDLPDKGKRRMWEVIVAVLVSLFVLVSGGFLGCFYTRRTKQKEGKRTSGEDLLSFDFNCSVKPTDDGTVLRDRNYADFDLPMFSYASVSAATDNFSPDNKLGEGGFGPVYKGKLLNGQEIALKRLSKKSGQGSEEFRNEILLIAKLQHRNLVRLLGCCIDPEESILIYEYMPNKSLDLILFGSDKQEILDWTTRARILEGIAQGLLYLHEYSRVRIIHRDLKASNILLDEEMNPKISDFGMARIFGGNDSRTYTKRIVGTYGYMAPEYALHGLFSIKSDVFSFGVLVLEIVSGKKNTGFYHTDILNLLGRAWELWVSGRGVELVDPAVRSPPSSAALRYINVGLLCVQENPNDRPNMSGVISMLSSELSAPLPAPKQPAFSTTTLLHSAASVVNSPGGYSVNGLTVSAIPPR